MADAAPDPEHLARLRGSPTACTRRLRQRTAGTSFTITSSSGTDTSVVAYQIFEPA